MTHDEKIVEAVATAEVRYDGYEDLLCLGRTMRERYIDRARAAITAYQAEAWQDISTAPKDGTEVLVSGFIWNDPKNDRWQQVASWNGQEWSTEQAPLHPPTHWQPIPTAPKATP